MDNEALVPVRLPVAAVLRSTIGRVHRILPDVAVVVVLAGLAFVGAFAGGQRLGPIILDTHTFDTWFEADVPRVYLNMVERGSDHYRTKVHPLFSLFAFPPTRALRTMGLDRPTAARVVTSTIVALWIAIIFLVLRLIGLHLAEALLFTLLAAVSASVVFWSVVPETFPLGSVSILTAVGLVAVAARRRVAAAWYVVAGAFSLSFSTTNWMSGLLAAFVTLPWRRAAQIAVNGFCVVVLLWGVQKAVFPSAVFFLGDREEARYVLRPEAARTIAVTRSFLFHSIITPVIAEVEATGRSLLRLSVQSSRLGSSGFTGAAASAMWAILLALGAWGLLRTRGRSALGLMLGLTLLGQLVLHVVYGEETFNYAAHFGPLLVIVAACSVLSPARRLALLLAAAVVVTAGLNNWHQLQQAQAFVRTLVTQQAIVRQAIEARPADAWPRNKAHVVLAWPGSGEAEKAYHEPGGSFSPTPGSLGLSIWILGNDGQMITTSDQIPLEALRQRFAWGATGGPPAIVTESPYYRVRWHSPAPGRWTMRFSPYPASGLTPAVLIRSVGPAGGPIRSLTWTGGRLVVNGRRLVLFNPSPVAVVLGKEGDKGWAGATASGSQWSDEGGWGYAKAQLTAGREWTVQISDIQAAATKPSFTRTTTELRTTLPDPEFASSLNAQVAHMLMATVGAETRPGDPMTYPLAWQRDGAYIVAALARAGSVEEAKGLSQDLAERDFFGGFGPEADAPGLAIWALEEVAGRVRDPEFDRRIWPHVRRKADLISEMLSTRTPLHRPVVGPVVPRYARRPDLTLVAEPARNGLIVGRMDWGRPRFYVNAVSYRGLLDAAALATRLGEASLARRWRAQAEQLRAAWSKAFRRSIPDPNNRTYIVWPAGVWAADREPMLQVLLERWTRRRNADGGFRESPQWPYFDLAETHLWLLLGRPDRAWATLQWFWNHQASPGLYTWWEGEARTAEVDPFGRWKDVRGWIDPPQITPHYWVAAEMLLLQIDMLAYVDDQGEEPVLVIGAGVPPAWLRQPMRVDNLMTRVGRVDWAWDGEVVRVKTRDCGCRVRLGPAFDPTMLRLIEESGRSERP